MTVRVSSLDVFGQTFLMNLNKLRKKKKSQLLLCAVSEKVISHFTTSVSSEQKSKKRICLDLRRNSLQSNSSKTWNRRF